MGKQRVDLAHRAASMGLTVVSHGSQWLFIDADNRPLMSIPAGEAFDEHGMRFSDYRIEPATATQSELFPNDGP